MNNLNILTNHISSMDYLIINDTNEKIIQFQVHKNVDLKILFEK